MPYVFNGTKEDVVVKLQGKYFSFKPEQIKQMDEDKAQFISMERKESGLSVLPEAFEDLEFRQSEEGQKLLQEARERGIDNLINFHREVIKNNQVSLRKDLARAGEKVDPAVEVSAGELASMQLVAKYQKSKDDAAESRIQEVKELMKKVGTL